MEILNLLLTILGSHWTPTILLGAVIAYGANAAIRAGKKFGPPILKGAVMDVLSNGGGEKVRDIVAKELRDQDSRSDAKLREAVSLNDQKLKEAFAAHERLERSEVALTLATALSDAHREAAQIGARLDVLEMKVETLVVQRKEAA